MTWRVCNGLQLSGQDPVIEGRIDLSEALECFPIVTVLEKIIYCQTYGLLPATLHLLTIQKSLEVEGG